MREVSLTCTMQNRNRNGSDLTTTFWKVKGLKLSRHLRIKVLWWNLADPAKLNCTTTFVSAVCHENMASHQARECYRELTQKLQLSQTISKCRFLCSLRFHITCLLVRYKRQLISFTQSELVSRDNAHAVIPVIATSVDLSYFSSPSSQFSLKNFLGSWSKCVRLNNPTLTGQTECFKIFLNNFLDPF